MSGPIKRNKTPRNSPHDWQKVVEEMKGAASSDLANLVIVEIPDDTEFEIDDYDGMESIHETHKSWG